MREPEFHWLEADGICSSCCWLARLAPDELEPANSFDGCCCCLIAWKLEVRLLLLLPELGRGAATDGARPAELNDDDDKDEEPPWLRAEFGFCALAWLAAASWASLGSLTCHLAEAVSSGLVPTSLVLTVAR